jgi:HSP20 family protein
MKLVHFYQPAVCENSNFDTHSPLQALLRRALQVPGAGDLPTATFPGTVDLYEEADRLVARVDLPGVAKDDVKITLKDEVLTITAERREPKRPEGSTLYRNERIWGTFQRSLYIPIAVKADEVHAAYRDGVLTVTMPKAEEAKPRQITIRAE